MTAKELKARLGEVLNATYRLDRLIGEGGMGTVYEASHTRVPRKFAVKLLSPDAIGNREIFERFQREAEIASSLGHDHITQVFDFNYTPDGVPYMVLELLEGEDLAHRLRARGRMSVAQVATLLEQLADALTAAHAGKVIHRDLKPQNIFMCRRGQRDDFVKILDFGISKIVHASSSATRTGLVLGTPNYMAPEQAEGRHLEIDHRADLFALGAILYECLTARMAFDAPTPIGTMYQVCHGAPDPIRAFAPEVSDEVERVVLRALAKRRDDRYSTVGALLADFTAAAKGRAAFPAAASLPTVPTPVFEAAAPIGQTTLDTTASQKITLHPAMPPRRRVGVLVAAVVAVAGAAGLYAAMKGKPDAPAAASTAAAVEPKPGPPVVAPAPPPAPAPPATIHVRLRVTPADAQVQLDGKVIPPGDDMALAKDAAARHQVILSAPGHVAERIDFTAGVDLDRTVALVEEPPPPAPPPPAPVKVEAPRPAPRPQPVKAQVVKAPPAKAAPARAPAKAAKKPDLGPLETDL